MAGMRAVSTGEARARLGELLDEVARGQDVVIERYGRSVAALIPSEDYEVIREELVTIRLARRQAEAREESERDRSVGQRYDAVARRWVPKAYWGKGPGWGMMGGFWHIHGLRRP